jgi:hypothetical protein
LIGADSYVAKRGGVTAAQISRMLWEFAPSLDGMTGIAELAVPITAR